LVVRPKGAIQEIKGKFIATVEIATKILDEFPAGEVEYPWKTHSVLMSSDVTLFKVIRPEFPENLSPYLETSSCLSFSQPLDICQILQIGKVSLGVFS
jgi:hypothetical protein